jgi:hypothetical protein
MSNAITTPEDLNEGDHICCAEKKSYGLIREVGELPTHEMRYIVSLNDRPELKFVHTHKHFSLPWTVLDDIFDTADMHEQYDYNK